MKELRMRIADCEIQDHSQCVLPRALCALRIPLWGILFSLLLILLSQECIAGVVIEQEMRDAQGKTSTVFLYFSNNQLRTDHPEGGVTTIMDFKNDRMVMIDHRSKSYAEIKFSQWEKEVSKGLKRENTAMKPNRREILVRKTGETAMINGFRTEKIEILADGQLLEENWVTRDVDLKEIGNVMEGVAKGFSRDFRSEMREGRQIYEKLKPHGFPILVKDYTTTYGLKGSDVVEVKKVEEKELKEETFLPPPHYQRIIPEKPTK
jgi:hypothetical protein